VEPSSLSSCSCSTLVESGSVGRTPDRSCCQHVAERQP
jgi:hypothetical protein